MFLSLGTQSGGSSRSGFRLWGAFFLEEPLGSSFSFFICSLASSFWVLSPPLSGGLSDGGLFPLLQRVGLPPLRPLLRAVAAFFAMRDNLRE